MCEIVLLCPDKIIFDKEMIEVMKFGSIMGYLLGIYNLARLNKKCHNMVIWADVLGW